MPATVRDILLMIRAKEDATRSLNAIAGSMRRAQALSEAASARARAASLRAQATQARLTGATRAQVVALQDGAKAWDNHARTMEKSTKRASDLSARLGSVGHVAQTTGIVMAAAGAAGLYGLKQAVDVASEWDKQVRLTFTQVDKRYKPSLRELSDIGLRVAKDIAVPFEQVQTALFDVFSSTEANMPQAESLLRSFSKAAVAGQTDIQTASRATIGLMNSFKIPFKDVNKLLDIQFQLVQEGVGTYEEWAQRIGLVSPSAARAGQSVETMAAALSTATRMGMSAARAGTSVARAFDAMSNPKTEERLQKIGVATRDAKGNFRPMVDVLRDWRVQLEKMPKEDRVAAILETLKGAGGTIEARRFLQNVLLTKGGLELFQDQIKEFATDKGAFQRAYDEMANSISAKSQMLHNAWMTLKLAIGQALMPMFLQLVSIVQRVVTWFNNLPGPVKNVIAQFLAWGSILAIVFGAVTALLGVLVSFAAVIAMAGSALLPMLGVMVGLGAAIGVVAAAFVGLGAALYAAYQNSETFRTLMQTIWSLFTTAGAIIKNFALSVWSAFNTYVMPALRNLWQVISVNVLPVITDFVNWSKANLTTMLRIVSGIIMNQLKPAFQALGAAISTYVKPMVLQMVAWWKQNKQYIQPLISVIAVLIGILLVLAGKAIATAIKALAMFLAIVSHVMRTSMNAFTQFRTLASAALATVTGRISQIINWFRSFRTAVQSAMVAAINVVVSQIARIRALFAGAGGWLVSAGANMIRGFISGIRSMIGTAVGAAISGMKSIINGAKSALGISSPSKVFDRIGVNTAQGYINGYMRELNNKTAAMSEATMFYPNGAGYGQPRGTSPAAAAGAAAAGKVFNQHITIHTQEIDPRKTAAELGWELQGRQ